MSTTAIEEQIQRDIASGLSREKAVEVLRSIGVETRFVPLRDFPMDSLARTLAEPPADTVGALVGSTKAIEKQGVFERFVVVVVYFGSDNKVSKVATKSLTAGP